MFTKNSSPFGLELLIRMKIVWGIFEAASANKLT